MNFVPASVAKFVLFGAILASLLTCEEERPVADSPNIIFILTDDLGWNEFGFNNPDLPHTPNIDALQRNGLTMTQFYVHAVCAPTRTAFLTGRYPYRNWTDWRTEDFGKPSYLEKLGMALSKNEEGEDTRRIHALPSEERTIAEALSEAGYFNALIGKWGCGEWLPEHLPLGQGFHHQYGHYAWGIDYNNYTIPHNAPARFAVYDWHRNQEPLFEQGYSTDLIANEAVRLLADHRRDREGQPFFYYIPFNGIHGPLEETPRYGAELGKRYAALKCLDDAVGRIVSAVDQNGFADNTLIVLANDNGAIRDSMNAPYRGTKNTNYEGGVRTPCVWYWPGEVAPGTSNELMHIVDLYSTFLRIGGGNPQQPLPPDGMDMRDVVFTNGKSSREEIIFEVDQSVRPPAMRLGPYKLIGKELYNIEQDPGESTDLSTTEPEVLARLQKRLAEAGAERPPLPQLDLLMTPALPWVYGQQENERAPQWVRDLMAGIRSRQPQDWAPGTTPWPQAPQDGKIIYTGDGR